MVFYPEVANAFGQPAGQIPICYRNISLSCRIGLLAVRCFTFLEFVRTKALDRVAQIGGALRFLFVASFGIDARCHPDLDTVLPLAGAFRQSLTLVQRRPRCWARCRNRAARNSNGIQHLSPGLRGWPVARSEFAPGHRPNRSTLTGPLKELYPRQNSK